MAEETNFEKKMIELQEQANKRLKGIDSTLDWFFWLMIIGVVIWAISFFMSFAAL